MQYSVKDSTLFRDSTLLHNGCLILAFLAFLAYLVRANAAASVQNFTRWLDELAVGATNGGNPLVHAFDGHRLEVYYHKMKQPEHAMFMNAITKQTKWARPAELQCWNLRVY